MKTYFQYLGQMSSKGLGEAISLIQGYGPLSGFGGHSILDNTLIITSTPQNKDSKDLKFYNKFNTLINDRIKRRSLIFQDQGNSACFSCVTKDGYIWVSDQTSISLPIEGIKGVTKDVIVVAVHSPIYDAVENPVEFRAFWSQGQESFYNLYKRSIDPGYPLNFASRDFNQTNPSSIGDLDFSSLEKQVMTLLPDGVYSENRMTLIGVYGQGSDVLDNNALENYRIIPYESKFPMELEYNTGERAYIQNNLSKVRDLTQGVPSDYSSIVDYLKNYIKNQLSGLTVKDSGEVVQPTVKALPKGTIVMWYGTIIPEGWELCDGEHSVHDPHMVKPNLCGRFPVGEKAQSVFSPTGTIGGNENGQVTITESNLPIHKHTYVGIASMIDDLTVDVEGHSPYSKYAPTPWKNRDLFSKEQFFPEMFGDTVKMGEFNTGTVGGNQPFNILPPYTVVQFIIKTVDD